MRVLVAIPDLFVLAGNVHMTLKLADMLKDMGHDVNVIYSDIRPDDKKYYSLDEITEYYPLKTLDAGDFEKEVWMDYYNALLARLGWHDDVQYDLFVTSYENLAYINEDVDIPQIFYVHWPDRPKGPTCSVWTNSEFTRQKVLKRWRRDAEVLNPPIHIERYESRLSFDERDIDVIGFGQLYPQKGFRYLTPFHERGFNAYVIGADVRHELPRVTEVVSNATFKEVRDLLSRTKVFVHGKTQEHFGMAIIEAQASGCATITHRSGGPVSDIILDEKYGLLFQTEDELVSKGVRLLTSEEHWKKYHQLALEGVKRYDYPLIKNRMANLLRRVRDT